MSSRIVLFGATGYTGDLTARALVANGVRPVLAARSQAKLDALAAELGGLETAVADVSQPDSVRALVERGDVLISTVGPFVRWGEPAVQAAIAGGAHYLDSTGETPFIRSIFERHGAGAQAAGVALLTAMGYDWVPGNLAGALALQEAGEAAVRVEIGYFAKGTMGSDAMSGGTRASAAGALLEPSYGFRDGRIVTERGGRRGRSFDVGGKARQAISVGTSEHFALPRLHPTLREVDVFLGWFGPASTAVRGFSALTSVATKVPGVKGLVGAALGKAIKGSTGGPDAAAREPTRSIVVAEAKDAGGAVLASVHLEGVNGYDFTARMLAWGAEQLAGGAVTGTGALGPADAFGIAELEAGVAACGISRV